MSCYRRNEAMQRAQRWDYVSAVWHECNYDEPEVRVRPANEGMIVFETEDFESEGPLIVPIQSILAQLEK